MEQFYSAILISSMLIPMIIIAGVLITIITLLQRSLVKKEMWMIATLIALTAFAIIPPFGIGLGIYTFIKWRKRPTAKDKQAAAEEEWLKTGKWK